MAIWYTFSVLVCLDQEKSGNPGSYSNLRNILKSDEASEKQNQRKL
jgi:hypothetical protein